jgi:type IV secretion system protein VirD4
VVVVLQNLAQLDEVYSKAVRETLVSACATQLYIRIDDLDTSEYLSKMLGETTIELKRASLRRGGILGSKTINTDYDAVPLRTAQQLRQMDPRKVILLTASAPPFELERVIYHEDRPYKQALEQVRFKSVNVPELVLYADTAPVSEAPDRPAPRAVMPAEVAAMVSTNTTPIVQPASKSSVDERKGRPGPQSSAAAGPVVTKGKTLLAKEHTVAETDESAVPSSPSLSTESIPIEAILAVQIDAGAVAFRRVMEGLTEGGEHRELLDHLQRMSTLHEGFGDDEPLERNPIMLHRILPR